MSRELNSTKYDSPIEVVVEDLDGLGLVRLARWLLCDRDEDGWIRLANNVTIVSLPHELVPKQIGIAVPTKLVIARTPPN